MTFFEPGRENYWLIALVLPIGLACRLVLWILR